MDLLESFLNELTTPDGLQVTRVGEQEIKVVFNNNNAVTVREQPDGLYITQNGSDMFTQQTAQESAQIVRDILYT